jgi:glycosidase
MNPLPGTARALLTLAVFMCASSLRSEVILQYFETRWDEMYQRLPEIAETGYESIWTPPPGKSPIGGPYPFAYGGNVGYNSFDRFDLGEMPQRGNWETRYGSRTSLRNMVDNAHQNDIKIYPDIVFNHTGNGPDFRTYPGMVPQDFHITIDGTQPGGYRRPPRMFLWDPNNGTGGTLYQELVSLMDIVLEFDGRFQIGGYASQGFAADPAPFIRHPGDRDKYPYNSTGTLPTENSRQFIVRWINWLGYAMDYDGVRLDAPKHVVKEFFGLPNQSQFDRDRSFIYNIQKNFNERRGLSDTNPFDDMYANDIRRDDAMVYSEFFIGGIGEVNYWRDPADPNNPQNSTRGGGWGIQTRYLDFPRKKGVMQDAFQNGNLGALAGFGGFDPTEGVMFAQSHDEGPPAKLELAYAYTLTHVGVPVVYFSGNNLKQSEIGRTQGKNTWMEKGYDYALGDTVNNFQSSAIPNLVYIHNQFCRGREYNRWGENDFFAYERYDDLNSNNNPDSNEGLILIVLNDSGSSQTRSGIQTAFAPGTVLKDYSGNNASTVTVGGDGKVSVTVPPRNGQGWVCYAPFNADAPTGVDPLQFTGSVTDMPWVVPGGRDGVAKPRTLRRVSGNSVTIDVRFNNPAQGGETVDNVLIKWGQGRNLNASAADFTGKDIVTGGFEQATQVAPGQWRLVADLTGVPEGLHNIKARVFNGRSGKPALFQTFSETVYVDRSGPDLVFENLNAGETIEGARVVTINNPDRTLYNLTYSVDGGSQQQADMVIRGKWRLNLDGLSSGAHSITLHATEADYGSTRSVINTASLTRNFNVDTAGPTIALNHANGSTMSEPFFKTIVTVPTGQGITASDIKLYWDGFEQSALTENPAGSGNFESTFDGRYMADGVQRQFTGAFVNGPHFFEAVVTKAGAENRVSRKVVYNLFGLNMQDSDGDGIPDEIELSGFLDGTNPGPDQQWPGDNSKDLIPNYGESWTRLNPMAADSDYVQRSGTSGSWDGDEDWDGDGVSNLQEVIRGYRLTGDPYRYNIYNNTSTPPASSVSAASATLTSPGGVKTVTVTYNPNDGPLKTITPVRVRMQPTGGGSVQFFTMTQVNSNEFTYAYTVPGGVTSVAYSFSNADGSVNDTTGGAAWTIATPPVPSSATSTLGVSGSTKTVTVVYRPNEGPLSGHTPVNVNFIPTGGGSPASFTMTPVGDGSFTYTYNVPSGATSVSFSFTSGSANDTTGGAGWAISTVPGFVMDGLFDSQNFLVSDNGMRIYAAIRGNKLYTATWSPKGGSNDHVICITDQFGNPVTVGPATASDSGSNYSAWASGDNQGSGFDAWSISTAGTVSGVFLGDPSAAGIQGMDVKSFGLYAKGGSASSATAVRSFPALNVGDSIAFQWSINWDGGNGADGKKGFNIWAGSTFLMNVENAGTSDITVGGTSSGMGYGTAAMNWSITRTAADTLQVRVTRRDGGIFTRTLTVSASAPTRVEFYANNLNGSGTSSDNDKRQPYFNDLRIYRSGASAKDGRIYGSFDGSANSKPWIFATPSTASQYGFKASGRNWMGNAGQALESELDLVEAFGAVPSTIYIAVGAYSGGFGGTLLSQAPASFGDQANDIEIPELQALNSASIRDENLDGIFDVGTPEMKTVVGNDEADGNYGLRRFYIDEVLKETAQITVKFKPNTAATQTVTSIEVFTNLNRRDLVVLEENPATVTTSSDTYFRAYLMVGPDANGYYTYTLPVNRCGAYRLQVRYKIDGGPGYTYHTDHAQRRDCAIVVSPRKTLKSNMYEVNPLIMEAKDTTFAGRSTFLDLVNDPSLPGESGGYDGRPEAINKTHYSGMGLNMIWLQPIHPVGVESRDTNPETNAPFDPGSPYAVQDYWSVAPMLGRGAGTSAATALAEFQTFVSRLDQWDVSVMMDGTFNHSAPDAIMGQGAVDLGFTNNPSTLIRNFNTSWYAKEGLPSQPAQSLGEIAIAPDRNDFGNWTDVREFYFGNYDTLVKAKGPYNSTTKSYPDNANRKEYLLERDEFFGHTPQTRQVWEYFAHYPIYWLEKTGHPRGTPKTESYKGIDGLRCDFAQGLPSQFWEYCINKTRSVKWDFLFMAESLDGFREVNGSKRHGVGYRSARHFDVLNENIVFYWRDNFFGYPANGGAGTPATPSTGGTFNAYDARRQAFDNITLLNNLVSHDEVFPHNDVFSIAYAYSQVGALDGIPMLFYGQEAGAQNSKTGYAASEANFGSINTARNFAKYETNFGKNIPNFKVYNHMANIWNSGTRSWDVQTFYGRVNGARKNSPALQSQNVYFLNKKASGGGFNNGIFAVGKVQQPGLSAGQQDVMFVFVNNNYRTASTIADTFDLNALAPSGTANYFGIERGKTYNVKDLLSDTPDAYVWTTARTGADILDNGLYVGLPYQPTPASASRHAHYLRLIDQTTGSYPDLDNDGLYDATDEDMDGDGISNPYEEANGMNPRSASGSDGASADNDGDGCSNYVEFLAGTKANDSTSALRVVSMAKGVGSVHLTWSSIPGGSYLVRYSTDLTNAASWTDFPGGVIMADSAQTSIEAVLPTGESFSKLFFTVELVP